MTGVQTCALPIFALKKPEVRERFISQGPEAMGGTPEQLTAVMKTEIERLNHAALAY